MRDIKFRAWYPKERRWYRGAAIQLGATLGNTFSLNEANSKIIELSPYTGLKDRLGKDIYEGDILNINTGVIDTQKVIEYIDNGFWVKTNDGLWLPGENYRTIIGNIYETPELLENDK